MFGISRDLGQPAPLAKLLGKGIHSLVLVPQQVQKFLPDRGGGSFAGRTAVTGCSGSFSC